METCYALFSLNVLIEGFFFSARYQVYFKNLKHPPCYEVFSLSSAASWKRHDNNAHTGHTKWLPPCWYKAGHPLSGLRSGRKRKGVKVLPQTQIFSTFVWNKLPMKVSRSRQYKGKTTGKILSSAVEVHKRNGMVWEKRLFSWSKGRQPQLHSSLLQLSCMSTRLLLSRSLLHQAPTTVTLCTNLSGKAPIDWTAVERSHYPAAGTWFNGDSVPTHCVALHQGQCWWEHPAWHSSPAAPGAQTGIAWASFLHPPSPGQDRKTIYVQYYSNTCTPAAYAIPVLFACHQHKT